MPFELDAFLPYRLSVAAAAISRRFALLYADEAGLTVPEWRVMAHLHGAGNVGVRDITARVNLDKSLVSRAATRLEEAGLVRKTDDDQDRRLILIALTEEGEALMERLGRIAEKFQAQLLADLGDDAPAFLSALERLANPSPQGTAATARGSRIRTY